MAFCKANILVSQIHALRIQSLQSSLPSQSPYHKVTIKYNDVNNTMRTMKTKTKLGSKVRNHRNVPANTYIWSSEVHQQKLPYYIHFIFYYVQCIMLSCNICVIMFQCGQSVEVHIKCTCLLVLIRLRQFPYYIRNMRKYIEFSTEL